MNRPSGLTAASLVLVGVLGVAGAAWFAQTSDQPFSPHAAQEATPSPSPTSSGDATDEAEEDVAPLDNIRVTTYEVFLSRDPFEPVIVSAAPATSPDGAPTTSPTTSPTASPTGTPSPDPAGTESPSPSDCVDNGTVVCDGQTVALVDVFEDSQPGAIVRVNETIYEVRAGETFAGNFQVVSVEPPCATLLFGDDAFTLCEGETTLK